MKNNTKAFTLVEIMVVVAIIAGLAAIAIPNLLRARINANQSVTKANLKTIASALETYLATNNVYPTNLNELLNANPAYLDEDFSSGTYNGYTFTFNLSSYTYSISAYPSNGLPGMSTFTMTTGAILTEN